MTYEEFKKEYGKPEYVNIPLDHLNRFALSNPDSLRDLADELETVINSGEYEEVYFEGEEEYKSSYYGRRKETPEEVEYRVNRSWSITSLNPKNRKFYANISPSMSCRVDFIGGGSTGILK